MHVRVMPKYSMLPHLQRFFRNTHTVLKGKNRRGFSHPTHPTPHIIVVFEGQSGQNGQGASEVPVTPLSPDTANGYKRLAQCDNKFANSHSGSESTLKVQREVNHHSPTVKTVTCRMLYIAHCRKLQLQI